MRKTLLFLLLVIFAISFYDLSAQTTVTIPQTGYTTVTGCDFMVYDHGGPTGDYEANCDGYIVIYPEPGSVVVIESGTYDVEMYQVTDMDFDGEHYHMESGEQILVYSGVGVNDDNLLASFDHLGEISTPISSTASNGALTIRFISDYAVNFSGFEFHVTCVTPTSMSNTPLKGCSFIWTDPGGISFPYANNQTYTQTICSQNNEALVVSFSAFDLLEGDVLSVYNGSSASAPLIGTYTGNTIPGQIVSSGTCLTFRFISDGSGTSSGWLANIACREGCTPMPTAEGSPCANINPFCTDHGEYSYPSGTTGTAATFWGNTSMTVGCLYSAPAPAWYYMRIENEGDMTIHIQQQQADGTGRDVDFACWGPFTAATSAEFVDRLCCGMYDLNVTHYPNNTSSDANYPYPNLVDCSYDARSYEYCHITGAHTGEYYLLLITNFSQASGCTITFNKTAGAATTDCSIMAEASNTGPYCVGQEIQLICNNPQTGAVYHWSGPNGWSYDGTNPNPTVTNATLEMNGDRYQLIKEYGGQFSDAAFTTIVVRNIEPEIEVFPSTVICPGDEVTLSATCHDLVLLAEGFSSITTGGDQQATGTYGPGTSQLSNNTISTFPTMSYVYPAGGKVKLGEGASATSGTPGSMTSVPLDLSRPFEVIIRAKNWPWGGTGGGTVDGTLVVTAGSETQMQDVNHDYYLNYVFHFPAVAANTPITISTISTAHRLFVDTVTVRQDEVCSYLWSANPTTEILPNNQSQSITSHPAETTTFTLVQTTSGCVGETSVEITVLPPPVIIGGGPVCPGQAVELSAECAGQTLLEEDFGSVTTGSDQNTELGAAIGNNTLSMFPTVSKVYPAGGKVKVGTYRDAGSMTSVPLDLSRSFKVIVKARNWPASTPINGQIVVSAGSQTQTQPVTTTEYTDYVFEFTTPVGANQSVTIGTGVGDKRIIIDHVCVEIAGNCTYQWSTVPSVTILPNSTSQNITANITETTVFTLEQLTGGCGQSSITVEVLPPPTITGGGSVCPGQPVELSAECAGQILLEEDFESLTAGSDQNTTLGDAIGNNTLSTFPTVSKVYPAGGKVKVGTNRDAGSMTSVPLDLSRSFKVIVKARNWPASTPINGQIVVSAGSQTQTQPVTTTEYTDYVFEYTTPVGANQSVTIGTGVGDKRIIIDHVRVESMGDCTYSWSAVPSATILPNTTSQSITANITQTTTFTLVQNTSGCENETSVEVTIMPPPTITGGGPVCSGGEVTLSAECSGQTLLEEDFESLTTGSDQNTTLGDAIGNNILPTFPTVSKVYPAGGKVKIGTNRDLGSMTSVPLDLSQSFKVIVTARNWPASTPINGQLVVSAGSQTQTQQVTTTEYTDYVFEFSTPVGSNQSVTISTGEANKRIIIDYVRVETSDCEFQWTASPPTEMSPSNTSQSITAHLTETTTFTLQQTTGSCTQTVTQVVSVSGNPGRKDEVEECCSPYVWTTGDGLSYSAGGTYYYEHEVDGCVRVDTLVLTFLQGEIVVSTTLVDLDGICEKPADPTSSAFSVTDVCTVNPQVVVEHSAIVENNCQRTQQWWGKYTDRCGNVHYSDTVTYTWTENPEPEISTELTSHDLGCNPTVVAPVAGDFTVTDPCATNPVVTVTAGAVENTSTCGRSRTWTATYTDGCGNPAEEKTVTYTWIEDHTPPTVGMLPDLVVEGCDESAKPEPYADIDALNAAGAGISDECGEVTLVGVTDAQPTGVCPLTVVRTYTITDPCGNENTISQNIIIEIGDNFTITRVDSVDTVTCFSMAESAGITLPVVADACGQVVQPTSGSPIANGLDGSCEGTVTYTYTYLNCAGDDTTWTFTYYILLPDTLSGVPADGTRNVTCLEDAIRPSTTSIQDVCGNTINPVFVDSVATIDNVHNTGTVVFRFSYEDCAGHDSIWTYTYIVQPEGFDPFPNADTNVYCVTDILEPATPTREVCGNPVTLSFLENRGQITNGCGDSSFVYNYTVNGQTYEWLYTYHVSPIDFDMPENDNTTVECVADAVVANVPMPTVTDYCGRVLTPNANVQIDTSLTNDCTGTIVFKFTYEDCANHSHIWMFTYNIQHSTLPHQEGVVNNVANVECLSEATEPTAEMLPLVKDVCGNELSAPTPVANVTWVEGKENCEGTKTYTYIYKDCANLEYEWVYTYNIKHVTPPSQEGAVAVSADVECVSAAVAPTGAMLPVVKDVCGNILGAPVPTSDTVWTDNRTNCEGTIAFTYVYADCEGLEYDWTYTYHIALPETIVSVPDDGVQDVPCIADVHRPTPAQIEDVCGHAVAVTFADSTANLNADGTGSVVFHFTYTDCAGHDSVWTFTYTLTPGQFTPPADYTENVHCVSEALNDTVPTITNCGETITVNAGAGTNTVVNGCGDITYVYNYTVNDVPYTWTHAYNITPEEFTIDAVPGESTVECVSQANEPDASLLPVVTDACDNPLTPTDPVVTPADLSTISCEGDVTYTYTYTDCANHSHEWTYTYHIRLPETIASVPADDGDEVSCIAEVHRPTPSEITDVCGHAVTVAFTDSTANLNADGTGTVVFRFTYTDCAGHDSIWTYTYTLAPGQFNPPADYTENVHCVSEALNDTVPTITNCGENVTLTEGAGTNTVVNGCGEITYVYNYTVNNVDYTWTHTYNVAPEEFTIDAPAGETTVQCLSAVSEPDASLLPTVMDACGNPLTPTGPVVTPADLSTITCEGEVVYTYTYTDCASHSHEWTYTYHIALPEIIANVPTDDGMEVPCIADVHRPTSAQIVDVCGNAVSVVFTDSIPNINPNGTGTVVFHYTYTDCAGHDSIWTYTYTLTPGQFTPPTDYTENVHCESEALNDTVPTITNCGENVVVTAGTGTNTVENGCGEITYVYNYTVNDVSYTWTHTYNIEPEEFTITAEPDERTVECVSQAIEPDASLLPVVADACGTPLTPTGPVVTPADLSTITCEGEVVYTYTYTDCASHSHEWTYTYHVRLPEAIASVPAAGREEVSCIADVHRPTPAQIEDVCGNTVTVAYMDSTANLNADGTGDVVFRFTYTDCAGHDSIWTYTYTLAPGQFDPPTDYTENVHCVSEALNDTLPTITNCGENVTLTEGAGTNTVENGCGEITYVYNYTVNNVNYTWTHTYNISPEEFAITAEPGERTVECVSQAIEPDATLLPVVADACGNLLTPTGPVVAPADLSTITCEGDVTYTYTYTDCANHSHSWTYTYHIALPETIASVPENGSDDVPCIADVRRPTPAQIEDVCGNAVTVAFADSIPDVHPDGTGTVVFYFTYTDCAGHDSVWTYTYTLTPGQFTPIADYTENVHCVSEALNDTVPTITNCGENVTLTEGAGTNTVENGCGEITYVYEYTVNNVNYTWTHTYNIAPEEFAITAEPGERTVECVSQAVEPDASLLPVVADACGTPLTPTGPVVTPTDLSTITCEGDVVYTYTYTDCAGHSHDWTYTYHVVLPEVVMPENGGSSVPCPDNAVIPETPVVTDACGREILAVAVAGSPVSDITDGTGTVTYSYTYTDCTGRDYVWQYVYTVSPTQFNPPMNDTTQIHCVSEAHGHVLPDVDICGAPVVLGQPDSTITVTNGCGDITLTYGYQVNGTPYTWSYTYQVSPEDFTITAENGETTVQCLSAVNEPDASLLPTVMDACSNPLTPAGPVVTPADLSTVTCEGDVVYTYTYADCAGHSHDWTYTYHIALPNIIDNVPANDGEEVPCIADVHRPTPAQIEDVCGHAVTVAFADSIPDIHPDGTGSVVFHFTYTDCAGHDSVWTYTYTLVPGQFTPPADYTENVHCVSEALNDTVPTITNCGETITVNPGEGTNTVVNGCGDITYVYNYTVNDVPYTWTHTYHITPAPFTVPADQELTIQCMDEIVEVTPPVVLNSCQDTIHPIALPVVNLTNGCTGYYMYAWDYMDCAGDSARWKMTYIVSDTTRPVFTVPADVDICKNADGSYNAEASVTGMPTQVSDNCVQTVNLTIEHSDVLIETAANVADTIIRTWMVTDSCDNVNSQIQRIIIHPTIHVTVEDEICEGELYDTLNFNFIAVNDTIVTVTTPSLVTGCDSTITLNLTVHHPVGTAETVEAYGSYTWNGTVYEDSDTAYYAHPDLNGCTQVDTLYLTVFHTQFTTWDTIVCDSLVWNDVVYYETGNYEQTFQDVNLADSVVTVILTVNHRVDTAIYREVCNQYEWNETTYTESGEYVQSFETVNHCDSIVTLHLTVNYDQTFEWYDTVCNVTQWNESVYTESGDYVQHFSTSHGCDSMVTLHLVVNYSDTTAFDAVSCYQYVWEGVEYTQSGDVTRTFTNQHGCDSVVTMHLIINDTIYNSFNEEACNSYTWNGETYTSSGDYVQQFMSASECDSIVTLHLTLYYDQDTIIYRNVCDSYESEWGGHEVFTESGVHEYHIPTAHGCDSTITLNLTVRHSTTSELDSAVCASDLPLVWNGVTFTGGDTQTATLTNSELCDSLVTMHLTIKPDTYAVLYDTIVQNHLPYDTLGMHFTEAGTQSTTIVNSAGCDSIVTMNLFVLQNMEVSVDSTICENELPIIWNNVTFTGEGTQNVILTASSGVDSVVVMTLHVNMNTSSTIQESVVENDLPHTFNGHTFNAPVTNETIIIPNADGCDSIITYSLNVWFNVKDTVERTICENELPYSWNNVTFNGPGMQNVTLPTAHGADSVLTMILNVNYNTTAVMYDTIVENSLPYHFLGLTFTEAGTQTDTIANSLGCDSIVTMHLHVWMNVINADVRTICENELPYQWDNITFTQAGFSDDTLSTSHGADSILRKELVVNLNTYAHLYDTIVENSLPYDTLGMHFADAGTLTDTIANANGCDSIVTMSLHVWYNVTARADSVICEGDLPLVWNGLTFNGTDTLTVTLLTTHGADSVLTMYLRVNPNTYATLYDTIVENSLPYDTLGMHFADAGTQTDTIANANGCDSIVTMNLHVWYNVYNTIDSIVCENDLPIVWNGVTFTEAMDSTIVLVGNHGVDSNLTMHLAVIPIDVTIFNEEVCEGSDYMGHGFVVPGSQTVNITGNRLSIENTFQNRFGCDSIVRLELDIIDTSVYIRPLFDYCDNLSTTLSVVSTMTDYVWNTGETSPNIDITMPGVYTVTAMQGECVSSAFYKVEKCDMTIYLPNAITPGKLDGTNDCFSLPLRYQNQINDFEITIFNRWGQPVFHSKDKSFKWYGEYQGDIYRQNVYNYIIYYTDNDRFRQRHQLKGSITVL